MHKVFAGRELDWADVERVLTRQHGHLGFKQIKAELKPLLELKGETEVINKLDQIIARIDRRLPPRI